MNRRLQQFLSAENLSQAQFADAIGVARASISHILAGRNKPGFDFIEKMAVAYPDLNLDWLICGKGKMYKRGGNDIFGQLSPASQSDERTIDVPEDMPGDMPEELFEDEVEEEGPESKEILEMIPDTSTEKEKFIRKVVIFYNDNTYKELH